MVNNELVDLTHQNALDELRQAKEKLNHLSAQNARYVGLDSRLAAALQEKDDMHQERNSAIQTAKLAESRIASLKEKCGAFVFIYPLLYVLIEVRSQITSTSEPPERGLRDPPYPSSRIFGGHS